ncbi:MAG: hypothetical protein ACXVOI_10320, partial [Tumebacillaceae bacterium]
DPHVRRSATRAEDHRTEGLALGPRGILKNTSPLDKKAQTSQNRSELFISDISRTYIRIFYIHLPLTMVESRGTTP